MNSTDQFCLKWNDFESSVANSFQSMRNDQDFLDVTLACEDDEQLQAHKVVLSACSLVFKNILKKNTHSHPLIFLSGMKGADVKLILNFIYMDQVEVKQDNLNRFLEVAEKLKLEGLTTREQNHDKRYFEENPMNYNEKVKSENATNHVDSLDMEFILNDGPSKQQDDERNKELEILNDETLSHQVYDDSVTISDSSEIDIRIAELTREK